MPRVINLLCNRSLEEAYIFRLRIIDKEMVRAAARALGIGGHVAPATPPQPDATASSSEAGSEAPAVLFEAAPRPAAASRLVPYVSLAVLVVLAGVAILFGVRRARPPAATAPAPVAVSPAPRAPIAPAGQAPAAPTTPGAQPTVNRWNSISCHHPRHRGSIRNRRRILRTDTRATSVAAEVAALGLPVHRRVLEGWQQVVSGPFAARTDAEAAQQRIHRAGLTGTQIVPTPQ